MAVKYVSRGNFYALPMEGFGDSGIVSGSGSYRQTVSVIYNLQETAPLTFHQPLSPLVEVRVDKNARN